MTDAIAREFAFPGAAWRGKPFWGWNGKLEPEELRRQIRVMRRMGMGGFFMHARVGLATPYLSPRWFECVNACVDEAKKLKMEAWLYDEDRWPSGAAGGLVTKNHAWRQRMLRVVECDDPAKFRWAPGTLAAFTAVVKGHAAFSVRPIPKAGRPPRLAKGEKILTFRVRLAEPSSWYNGYTYLDVLNPAAVREFIRVTHEAYRRKCGRAFGKLIPGIFSDEPNGGDCFVESILTETGTGGTLPWTGAAAEGLPGALRLRPAAPPAGTCLRPRRPGRPARALPLPRLPQPSLRDRLLEADRRMVRPQRPALHRPRPRRGQPLEAGRDHLGVHAVLRIHAGAGAGPADRAPAHLRHGQAGQFRRAAVRPQVAADRDLRLQRLGFPLRRAQGARRLAGGSRDQPALPASLLVHDAGRGQARLPRPIGEQSPWWKHYGKVEDYFARLHAALTPGEEVRDILVIHPVESMWLQVRKDWRQGPIPRQMDSEFGKLRDCAPLRASRFRLRRRGTPLAPRPHPPRARGAPSRAPRRPGDLQGRRRAADDHDAPDDAQPPGTFPGSRRNGGLCRPARGLRGGRARSGPGRAGAAMHADARPAVRNSPPRSTRSAGACPSPTPPGRRSPASSASCGKTATHSASSSATPATPPRSSAAWDSTRTRWSATAARSGRRSSFAALPSAPAQPQEWDPATGRRFAANAARTKGGAMGNRHRSACAGKPAVRLPQGKNARVAPDAAGFSHNAQPADRGAALEDRALREERPFARPGAVPHRRQRREERRGNPSARPARPPGAGRSAARRHDGPAVGAQATGEEKVGPRRSGVPLARGCPAPGRTPPGDRNAGTLPHRASTAVRFPRAQRAAGGWTRR